MAARSKSSKPTGTLEEIESYGDRAAEWVARHARLLLVAVAAILLSAGSFGGYASWKQRRAEAASAELGLARRDYLGAMGADPGSLEVPELANPEAAQRIREEYVARFAQVADAHPGTVAAALARIQVAELLEALGEAERSLAAWQEALEEAPAQADLAALLLQRLASAHEDAGRWAEAAQAHERAAEIEDYPLRWWAMADAARCHAVAGNAHRATELFERIHSEAPEFDLPPHLRAQLRELRASTS